MHGCNACPSPSQTASARQPDKALTNESWLGAAESPSCAVHPRHAGDGLWIVAGCHHPRGAGLALKLHSLPCFEAPFWPGSQIALASSLPFIHTALSRCMLLGVLKELHHGTRCWIAGGTDDKSWRTCLGLASRRGSAGEGSGARIARAPDWPICQGVTLAALGQCAHISPAGWSSGYTRC